MVGQSLVLPMMMATLGWSAAGVESWLSICYQTHENGFMFRISPKVLDRK
jgi:hypothetical protein